MTHPTKWETTASRVYVPMGSPCPAISTNPRELSMEVPATPNQSANNYDVAGYHLMQAGRLGFCSKNIVEKGYKWEEGGKWGSQFLP